MTLDFPFQVSFETESDRGVLADVCVRGDNRELHCLLVSVTSPSKLHQDPDLVVADEAFGSKTDSAVHLIRWLVLTEKGEASMSVPVMIILKKPY